MVTDRLDMTLAVDWAAKSQHNKQTYGHFKSGHFATVCNAHWRFIQWRAWHERFAPGRFAPVEFTQLYRYFGQGYFASENSDPGRCSLDISDTFISVPVRFGGWTFRTRIWQTRTCYTWTYRTFAFRLDVSQLGVLQEETYMIEMSRCEVTGFEMSSCDILGAKPPGPVCQVHFAL